MTDTAKTLPKDAPKLCWSLPAAARAGYLKRDIAQAFHHLMVVALIGVSAYLIRYFPFSSRLTLPAWLTRPHWRFALIYLLSIAIFSVIYPLIRHTWFKVGPEGLGYKDLIGWRIQRWARIGAYHILENPDWRGFKILQFYKVNSFNAQSWPFDPAEIDEEQIRNYFEENGVRDLDEDTSEGGQDGNEHRADPGAGAT